MASTKMVRLVMMGSTVMPCTSAPRRRAVAAHERGGNDLVGSIDFELAGLRVEQQVDEVHDVARIECAGVTRHFGGEAGRCDDLHAVRDDDLVRLAERTVAP